MQHARMPDAEFERLALERVFSKISHSLWPGLLYAAILALLAQWLVLRPQHPLASHYDLKVKERVQMGELHSPGMEKSPT